MTTSPRYKIGNVFKIMENHEQANSAIASVYMRKKLTPLHVPRAYNSTCEYSDFLTVTE